MSDRIEYEYDIYKFSKDFSNEILDKHGFEIQKIYHKGCFVILKLLLEGDNANLMEEFILYYIERMKKNYVTTTIPINRTRNLTCESTDDQINEWISNNLKNTRSLCKFSFSFVAFLRFRSYCNEKQFESVHYLQSIENYFTFCIMNRTFKENKEDRISCLFLNKYRNKLPNTPPNDFNIQAHIFGQTENCKEMLSPVGKYSTPELEGYDGITVPVYETGADYFKQPTISKTSKNSLDVYRAGVSGHSLQLIFLFMLLLDDKIDNLKNIYLYVILGSIINMAQYYHHSLRESLVLFPMMFQDKNNSVLSDFSEQVLHLYEDRDELEAKGVHFKSVCENIHRSIDLIIKDNSSDPIFTNQYLKNLAEDYDMKKYKEKKGRHVLENLLKMRENMIETGIIDMYEEDQGDIAIIGKDGEMIGKMNSGEFRKYLIDLHL